MLIDDSRLDVVFAGDGPEKSQLVKRSEVLGLRSVSFLEAVPHVQIPSLLATADVALVPLRHEIAEAVPSKFYEALAAKLPVLLVSGGEAARLLNEAQAGLAVDPGDIASLARAMSYFSDNPDVRRKMGERGRAFVAAHFDRQKINDELITFLEDRSIG
jgi:glycosyltransferase involved in cell wall biosynthesis